MADVVLTNPAPRHLVTATGTAYTQTYVLPDGSSDLSCVYAPDALASGHQVDVVMYVHGISGDVDNWNNVRNKGQRDALMDDGNYVVVACDGALQNFGNNPGLAAYLAVLAYAKRTYNVRYLHTIGQSMGGIIGNLACLRPEFGGVRGCLLISPICSLAHAWVEGFRTAIQAAYGISGATFDEAVTAGHDPIGDYLPTVWPATTQVLAYASPDDTTVSMVDNAMVLVNRLQGHVTATLQVVTGGHLSSAHYDPPAMLAFFAEASGDDPPPPIIPPTTVAGTGPDYLLDGVWCKSARAVRVDGAWQPVAYTPPTAVPVP